MLLINEIYPAILGESRLSGETCAIVRLTGCHRRCRYCDTEYAFSGGTQQTVASIGEQVRRIGFRTVLVTGGEPLLQRDLLDLLRALVDEGYRVVLETSGTTGVPLRLDELPAEVVRVVDVKTPGSGLAATEIDWDGLATLGADDEIKIVCCGRADYVWARDEVLRAGRLPRQVPITLAPVWGELEPRALAEWILAERLPVRFQVQLHKIVWPDAEGGV